MVIVNKRQLSKTYAGRQVLSEEEDRLHPEKTTITPIPQARVSAFSEQGKVPTDSKVTTNKIEPPQPATISPQSPTSSTEERFKKVTPPLRQSIAQSARNVFNFGIVGQQGTGAYFKNIAAPLEPYWYGGERSMASDVSMFSSYPFVTMYRKAKEYQEFRKESPGESYLKTTPEKYEIMKTKKGYESTGLSYTGESIDVIEQRFIEKGIRTTAPGYETELKQRLDTGSKVYQERINAGEDYNKVVGEYETFQKTQTELINKDFTRDITQQYAFASPSLTKAKQDIIQYRTRYSSDTGSKIGRATITAGEIVGYSVGATPIKAVVTGYQAYKQFGSNVEYAGSFNRLSMGQKIAGGVGVVAGTALTFGMVSGTVKSAYSDWRQAIIEDVYDVKGKGLGRQIIQTPDRTIINARYLRQTESAKAITSARTDIYFTGEKGSITQSGAYTRGISELSYVDPETRKLVTETVKYSGQYPIKTVGVSQISTPTGIKGVDKIIKTDPAATSLSVGKGYYIPEGSKSYYESAFYSLTKESPEYYSFVGGGAGNKIKISSGGSFKVTPQSYSTEGRIYKPDQTIPQPFYPSASGLSLVNLQRIIPVETVVTLQIQASQINLLSKPVTSLSSSSSAAALISPVRSGSGLSTRQISPQTLTSRSTSLTPTVTTPPSVKTKQVTKSGMGSSFGVVTLPVFSQVIQPVLGTTQPQTTIQSPGLIDLTKLSTPQVTRQDYSFGRLVPVVPSLSPYPNRGYDPGRGLKFGFGLPLLGFEDRSYKPRDFGVRGERSYTPSYSAFVFKIYGKQPKREEAPTGLQFQPITKGFSVSKRINNLRFKI